jgi:hypothetical protein
VQQGDQERHTSAGTTSTWERCTSAGVARERRMSRSAGARWEELHRCREELGTCLTHRSSPWSEVGTDLIRAERHTGEAGRPGAAHGQICEEDDWRVGGRATVTKEQRRRNQEGIGATSQEIMLGTRRGGQGGTGRSRGRWAQETEGER